MVYGVSCFVRNAYTVQALSDDMKLQSMQINKMSCNSLALPKSSAADDIVDDVKEIRCRWMKLWTNVATKQVNSKFLSKLRMFCLQPICSSLVRPVRTFS